MSTHSVKGKFLLASPSMPDPRFAKSVVFMCEHSPEGAMGIVVNRRHSKLSFRSILDELEIPITPRLQDRAIYQGGPVEMSRGFVLHSPEAQTGSGTMSVTDEISLSATLDILQDLALQRGPEQSLIALGYTGWGPGQLDNELTGNGWFVVDSSPELVFGEDIDAKWAAALAGIGVDASMLSSTTGRA